MTVLKCCYAKEDDLCFTNGKLYVLERDGDIPYVDDDEGDPHEISLDDASDNEWRPMSSSARLIEYDAAFSDEYEEAEWQRLEKQLEQCKQAQETCCDVALAYQLSQIQKFLRDSGSNIELVVHKDFIAINDEHCREYRGNVEQVIRFIKASGELAKVSDEMDRRN